jgi:hypothetical protein
MVDGSADADLTKPCWTISTTNPAFNVSACASAPLADMTEVSSNVSIDTDTGISTPAGFGCVPLASGGVCALFARSIVIRAGKTLSAHGTKPLALLGHDIDVEGVIDVASHSTGGLQAKGPAAERAGCNTQTLATGNGGGPGGTYDSQQVDGSDQGGDGGDSGGVGSKGGNASGSITVGSLLGGCAGGPSSGGPVVADTTVGSHGGGAVWIAVDTGTLVIGSGAVINASGAGGTRGAAVSATRGGYGGGSGGLIVLQAPTITQASNAQIFANGGGGGGGAAGATAGAPGGDPTDPAVGVGGGNGAMSGGDHGGNGGQGFPAMPKGNNKGSAGDTTMAGGGGGGGGIGAIRVRSNTTIMGANVSPMPIQLLD